MVRYFNKVLSLIQSSAFLADQKNKDILVSDVMKKTEAHAVKYAFSPKGSKVFEAVITWGSDPVVGKFMEKMEETVCDALSNPFASRVLKTLLEIAAERNQKIFDIKTESCENTTHTKITNVDVNQNWNPAVSLQTQICEEVSAVTQEEFINNNNKEQIKININCERTTKDSIGNNGENDDADNKFSFSEWILRVSKVVLDDVDLVWNLYANNVMRTVLECLTTLPRDSTKYFNKRPVTNDGLSLPEEHKHLLDCFTQKLLLWQQLTDLVYNDLTSRLLQALLLALKAVDNEDADDLVSQLFNECFIVKETDLKKKCLSARLCEDEATLLPVFRNEFSANVLQTSTSVASPELLARIHTGCFTGHLAVLSRSRIAGPCLRTLLQYCRGKEDFETIYNEICEELEEVILNKNTAVIVSLAQTCLRFEVNQGWFVLHLMRALHCDFPPGNHRRFIAHVLMLRVLGENTRETDFTIHPHGIALLEALLRFEFPNKVVSGMLKLKHHELCQLLSHHPDATIIRTFVENPNIPTNSMNKLFNTLVNKGAQTFIGPMGVGAVKSGASNQYSNANYPCHQKSLMRIMRQDHSTTKAGFGANYSVSGCYDCIASHYPFAYYANGLGMWKVIIIGSVPVFVWRVSGKLSTPDRDSKLDILIIGSQGRFTSLASSEYGSRSLEVLWKAVEARRKVQIMDELTEQSETLQNIPCGKFILKKFARDYYMLGVGGGGKRDSSWTSVNGFIRPLANLSSGFIIRRLANLSSGFRGRIN
uniref:Uncharacterized protein n=1 Tax=Timema bartmani TaxID=61472 RepID=A0A7R9I1N6_9NEOP|nr:unnamed protein product [Timema bartmani]